MLERPGHAGLHLARVEWLLHEVERAALHRPHRAVDRTVGREEDDGRVRRVLTNALEQIEPAPARHAEVGDDEIDLVGRQQLLGRRDVRRRQRGVPELSDQDRQRLQQPLVIVDHQDGVRAHRSSCGQGSRTITRAPRPATLSTWMRPRCSSTRRFEMTKPSPVPSGFVV